LRFSADGARSSHSGQRLRDGRGAEVCRRGDDGGAVVRHQVQDGQDSDGKDLEVDECGAQREAPDSGEKRFHSDQLRPGAEGRRRP